LLHIYKCQDALANSHGSHGTIQGKSSVVGDTASLPSTVELGILLALSKNERFVARLHNRQGEFLDSHDEITISLCESLVCDELLRCSGLG
jgi:hypothetical protein